MYRVRGVSDPDDLHMREDLDQTIGASDDPLGSEFPDEARHRTGDSLHSFGRYFLDWARLKLRYQHPSVREHRFPKRRLEGVEGGAARPIGHGESEKYFRGVAKSSFV